ncbi:MAG: hypothetical protein AABX01_00405 [Candidatus Micrarchaeota archaeon]
MRFTLMIVFLLILLMPIVRGTPNVVITSYAIYDSNGILASNGSKIGGGEVINSCTTSDPFSHDVHQNISAGNWFWVNITVQNTGTDVNDNENNGRIYQDNVIDPFGFYSGHNYPDSQGKTDNASIGNFSEIYVGTLTPNEIKNLTGSMNITAYTYMGWYWLEFKAYSSSGEHCQRFRLPVNQTTPSTPQFYLNITNVNVTGSDIMEDRLPPIGFTCGPGLNKPCWDYFNEFGPPYNYNWTLYLNLTVKNLGVNVPDPSWANASSIICGGNWVCANVSVNPWQQVRNVSNPINSQKQYDCKLLAPVGATQAVEPKNVSWYDCYIRLENSSFNFKAYKYFRIGPLGILPTSSYVPPYGWDPFITNPYPASIYALPGNYFNMSVPVMAYDYGNYTFWDNLNLTFDLYDSSYGLLNGMSELVIKNPLETRNYTTASPWSVKLVNLSIYVPLGTTPSRGEIRLFSTDQLTYTALMTSGDEKLDNVNINTCPDGHHTFWNNKSFNPKFQNICLWPNESIDSTRLLYLINTPDLVYTVAPGAKYLIPYEVRNGLSKQVTYGLSSIFRPKPLQNTPGISFEYFPQTIVVGAATSIDPGSNFGNIIVTIPFDVKAANYTYLINASILPPDFGIWDTAKLTLVVSAHDVEVVAIKRKPDNIVYDPQRTPRVDLSVIIRNTLSIPETVTLNLTVGGKTYVGCGGSQIGLGPQNTTEVICIDGGDPSHADLTGLTGNNIVVAADLALLSNVDTNYENNHFVDIISVVSSEQVTETVPEIHPALFLILVMLSLFAFRQRGLKI